LPQARKFYIFILVLLSIATSFRKAGDGLALIYCWVAVAASSAAWSLIQFGRSFLAAQRSGGGLYDELVGHRITGFMGHWMTFSGELMIVLMLLAALLMFSGEGRRRWRLLVPCAIVIALGLVLALTRGPWIGAAAGTVYLMWCWNRKSLLALPVLLAVGFFVAPSTVQERVASISRPRSYQDSNQHRIVLWRTGWAMVKAHPWFGLGPEQIDRQFDRYVPADIPRPLPWGWYRHMHNIYLQYAAERGLPVLLVFLWLAGKVLWDFRRSARAQSPGLSGAKAVLHGCIAALVAVLVAGIFEHNLGDSEMLQMFLSVIAIGYAAADTHL
jgi:O-antigen ligase